MPGPVAVGTLIDHRDVGWMQLTMLERARRNPTRTGALLPEGLLMGIKDNGGSDEVRMRELQGIIKTTTVLLAPATEFQRVAAIMQHRGVRVSERSSGNLRLLRLDAGAAATGIADQDIQPLPTIVLPPTPTPIPLSGGPHMSLTTMTPTTVTFGFAPPQIDHAWDGSPIVMGGVRYGHGIGTHAWCRMTYAVPPQATTFQAIVGLSDDVRECGAGAVTFEVRDDNDAVRFDSGLVDATTPARSIQADVRGTQTITLVVTEGGNGRDCDHANWALPAFLLPTP
ncbi:MAG: NPCBM/NEW2 domain-containing protein [Candidatus Binatia bacterium]